MSWQSLVCTVCAVCAISSARSTTIFRIVKSKKLNKNKLFVFLRILFDHQDIALPSLMRTFFVVLSSSFDKLILVTNRKTYKTAPSSLDLANIFQVLKVAPLSFNYGKMSGNSCNDR
jgi:hypothetical protein